MANPNGGGYANPPRGRQFKPGQSGNPRGRPKGAKGLRAELRAELDEKVRIVVDGKPRVITKRRLIIKALIAKAGKANVSAADKLLKLIVQAEGFEDPRQANKPLSDSDLLIFQYLLGLQEPEGLDQNIEGDPDPSNDEGGDK